MDGCTRGTLRKCLLSHTLLSYVVRLTNHLPKPSELRSLIYVRLVQGYPEKRSLRGRRRHLYRHFLLKYFLLGLCFLILLCLEMNFFAPTNMLLVMVTLEAVVPFAK